MFCDEYQKKHFHVGVSGFVCVQIEGGKWYGGRISHQGVIVKYLFVHFLKGYWRDIYMRVVVVVVV